MTRSLQFYRRTLLAVAIFSIVSIPARSVLAFKPGSHAAITRVVLSDPTLTRSINGHTLRFQPDAIDEIVRANTNQDRGVFGGCILVGEPGGSFAVSENHFDGEKLNEGSIRAIERLNTARTALKRSPPAASSARRFLGRVLHAVQDYYAHSNWVETSDGPDNRLGVSPITNVAGLGVATCMAPPQTGTYVRFSGLTSGYWFGCTGANDSLLPPGKCYHGWLTHAGTNKDDDDRDGFPEARQNARVSTRSVIDQLLDSEGIAGTWIERRRSWAIGH